MAKKINYSGRSKEELNKVVSDKREELRVLRFGAAGSKNKNVKAARTLRREVARALTARNSSTPLTTDAQK
jgi:ribosomal protein L29